MIVRLLRMQQRIEVARLKVPDHTDLAADKSLKRALAADRSDLCLNLPPHLKTRKTVVLQLAPRPLNHSLFGDQTSFWQVYFSSFCLHSRVLADIICRIALR